MATHNPKESRSLIAPSLHYVYRGIGHEHVVGKIKHLGGTIFSENPVRFDAHGNFETIDIGKIEQEFNNQVKLHRGRGEKLFKHYVISLAPNESLSGSEWLDLCREYMKDLGYDHTTKWLAVEHSDSACKHVHILSCRVKGDVNGSLVKTTNDYEKGLQSMRKYEKKFGLRVLENPDKNFGKNKSKGEIKYCATKNAAEHVDDAAIIRNRFSTLYKNFGKPSTMTGLVIGLAKLGVAIKVKQNPSGEIVGINYSIREGVWISGSKIKASRFTWTNLQKQERVHYSSERDDLALGLHDSAIEITLRLREQSELFYIKSLKLEIDRKNLLMHLRIKRSKDMELVATILLLLLLILNLLFGLKIILDDDYDMKFVPLHTQDESKLIDLESSSDIEGVSKFLKICKMFVDRLHPKSFGPMA